MTSTQARAVLRPRLHAATAAVLGVAVLIVVLSVTLHGHGPIGLMMDGLDHLPAAVRARLVGSNSNHVIDASYHQLRRGG